MAEGQYERVVIAAARAYYEAERALDAHKSTWTATAKLDRPAWRATRLALTEATITARLALIAAARGR